MLANLLLVRADDTRGIACIKALRMATSDTPSGPLGLKDAKLTYDDVRAGGRREVLAEASYLDDLREAGWGVELSDNRYARVTLNVPAERLGLVLDLVNALGGQEAR